MSQYRKTILAEFFFKAHSSAFLQKHGRVSSFLQPEKTITREKNVINFGGYFIYGGHLMKCQYQASDMHNRLSESITSIPWTGLD